jgi:hypothetical protein
MSGWENWVDEEEKTTVYEDRSAWLSNGEVARAGAEAWWGVTKAMALLLVGMVLEALYNFLAALSKLVGQ